MADNVQAGRRGFFKAAALGGAAAAAAVATTIVGRHTLPSAAVETAESAPTGYRESEHIKHYYRTTQV